jgi:hypothetical protein
MYFMLDYEPSNLKHPSLLFTALRGVFQALPFVKQRKNARPKLAMRSFGDGNPA